MVWSLVARWSKEISSNSSQNENVGLFISNSYSMVYSVHLYTRLDDLQLPVFMCTTFPIWRHTWWLISSCSMSSRKFICFGTTVSELNNELKWKQLMQAVATVCDISEAKAKIKVKCSGNTKALLCSLRPGRPIIECHSELFFWVCCPSTTFSLCPALKSFHFSPLLWSIEHHLRAFGHWS